MEPTNTVVICCDQRIPLNAAGGVGDLMTAVRVPGGSRGARRPNRRANIAPGGRRRPSTAARLPR